MRSGSRASPRSDLRFGLMLAGAVAFAIFSAAWLSAHPGDDRPTVAFDNVSQTVAALAAATACLALARDPRRQTRVAWLLIGLSALSWGLGQAYWTFQEVVQNQGLRALFSSDADLGFFGAVPFAVAGVIALPGRARLGFRLQVLLDGLLIGGGVLFLSWATVLGPLYQNAPAGVLQQVASVTAPICDVLLLTVVLLVLSRMPTERRGQLLLLAMGCILNAVANSVFAYLTTVQSFVVSNPVDASWTLGFCLIGLAALRSRGLKGEGGSAEHTEDAPIPRWRVALPYAPMLAAGLMAMAINLRGGHLDALMTWDGMGIVVVVSVRQLLLVRDTRRLDSQLRDRNRGLDRLVAERTAALHQSLDQLRDANDEARQLSLQLVTMQDEERRRLSAIIHDDMLQWMTVGLTRLQVASRGVSDSWTAAALGRVGDAIQTSITQMRGLMSELHPHVVERGFMTALREYLERVDRDSDLHCVLIGSFTPEPAGIVATTLFRITAEAVVNARKHAPGSTVTVELHDGSAAYVMSVTDDGPGFVPEGDGVSPTGHVGLSSMRERTQALGGCWSLRSSPGEGTRIEFCAPREAAPPATLAGTPATSSAPVPEVGSVLGPRRACEPEPAQLLGEPSPASAERERWVLAVGQPPPPSPASPDPVRTAA